MIVSWMPLTLEQAQGFITGYNISYQPISGVKRQAQSVRVPGDSVQISITGLEPAVSYTASLSAATAVGSGPISPPVATPGTYSCLAGINQYQFSITNAIIANLEEKPDI